MRISDWSSDVCSSDLATTAHAQGRDAMIMVCNHRDSDSTMKPIKYNGLLIDIHSFEEPLGVWWPNATIIEVDTGQSAPVSLQQHSYSKSEADFYARKEAVRRIRANSWKN